MQRKRNKNFDNERVCRLELQRETWTRRNLQEMGDDRESIV